MSGGIVFLSFSCMNLDFEVSLDRVWKKSEKKTQIDIRRGGENVGWK